jgi:signal transduction histidine kinase
MSVFGAAQDDAGGWWVNGMEGVYRFPPGELERALDDSTYVATSRTFDETDGMPGAPIKAYYSPLVAKSGDGKIWVAADSGLGYVDPLRLPPLEAPPVSIEVMRVEGREFAIADSARIPPGARDFEIDYTSLTFRTPERVRFRYRLDGIDTTWREVGDRRRAYFNGLAPGSYRFRVTASYGDGVWNEAGAGWSFRVLPAWYQAWWFRILAVAAIAALGGTVVALVQRGRHLRAQQVLEQKHAATLAERARIAQDLHDTLLQGFAGVTMQLKVAELALPDEPDVAAETLLRVQQLARESLREARERVWEMRDSRLGGGHLRAALESIARERTAGTGIEVSVQAEGEERQVPAAVEDAAFRIGREAIVNAVRHAGARRVELQLEVGPAALRLVVRDDGRGFTPQAGEDARRQGHFGLSGMRERAQHFGGRCEIVADPRGGTTVTLDLPLRQ